jgi:homoserine kinase type II
MSLELLEVFLRGYQDKMGDLVADPGRLNNLELRFLPQMIQAGNLYLIDWTLDSFYQTDSPVEEYLGYLKHMVRLSEWIEENAIIFSETTSGFKE